MRRFLVVVGACCVLGAALALAANDGSKLLYPSVRTGNSDLFLINPDGSDAKNLTNHKDEDLFPAWSPDGQKIAFASDRSGNLEIFVMDADGKNVKQLTDAKVTSRAPAWSPDGQKIAFCRHVEENNPEIFVMNADGSNPVNLTKNDAYDADPAWSPDGTKIAFASNRTGAGFRVYVMDTTGANVQDISQADNPGGFVYPAWSPDGKQIAFTDFVPVALEVFVASADGSKKRQLTKLGGLNACAAWSPDGKEIAFVHMNQGDASATLYRMNADGSNPQAVLKADVPTEGGRPAWKPK